VSDSHSIIGGYDDMYSGGGGGLGYQRTLRFSDKQPLQVSPKKYLTFVEYNQKMTGIF
jgi:hypothetical protein